MKRGADELAAVANRCVPCLEAMIFRSLPLPSEGDDQLMDALLAVATALKKHGVKIESSDFFEKVFHARKKQRGGSL